MPLDLDASERALLIDLITGAIESEVFPMSARAQRLRSILARLRADMAPPKPDTPDNGADQGC
jgi:hypothetical protein